MGKRFLAQVTHTYKTGKLTENARYLMEYDRESTALETHVIFFGPKGKESDLPGDVIEDIEEYVENRHAFEIMEKNEPELIKEILIVTPARKTPEPKDYHPGKQWSAVCTSGIARIASSHDRMQSQIH